LTKPKHEEKPKDEVEETVAAVAESKHYCYVPKSNHSKEKERKNKKWEGLERD
jgi:hypothetical protein